MLERIRIGDIGEPDILLLESQICGKGHEHNAECNNYSSPGVMVMCLKTEQGDNANREIMEATLKHQPHHWLKSCDYEESGRRATFHESEEIDCQKCVLPRYLDIRIGAKVSITRNLDQDGGVINGTRGFIKAVHTKVVIELLLRRNRQKC